MVITAQVFLDLIDHAYFSIAKLALIIFDECHHALGVKHPYRVIMDRIMRVSEGMLERLVIGIRLNLFRHPVNEMTFLAYWLHTSSKPMSMLILRQCNQNLIFFLFSNCKPSVTLYLNHFHIRVDTIPTVSNIDAFFEIKVSIFGRSTEQEFG